MKEPVFRQYQKTAEESINVQKWEIPIPNLILGCRCSSSSNENILPISSVGIPFAIKIPNISRFPIIAPINTQTTNRIIDCQKEYLDSIGD
jgi:hypothetical protein